MVTYQVFRHLFCQFVDVSRFSLLVEDRLKIGVDVTNVVLISLDLSVCRTR